MHPHQWGLKGALVSEEAAPAYKMATKNAVNGGNVESENEPAWLSNFVTSFRLFEAKFDLKFETFEREIDDI